MEPPASITAASAFSSRSTRGLPGATVGEFSVYSRPSWSVYTALLEVNSRVPSWLHNFAAALTCAQWGRERRR